MKNTSLLPALALAATLAACASTPAGPRAEAKLAPTAGNAANGLVSFSQDGDKLRVSAEISGLTPGPHGFHVHDKGDCSAPDATSAGGHFNPGGKAHGSPEQPEHHAGDLPQLVADAAGVARFTIDSDALSIGGGAANIVGRSVVVHAAADDFKSQPAGNSGARIACGVIVSK
ncbi:MAG: superoxide dismutase family protein [Proteobacteria bacterium]|nr:superoxide dismutase family protein [Pseudomonadota bacterium]